MGFEKQECVEHRWWFLWLCCIDQCFLKLLFKTLSQTIKLWVCSEVEIRVHTNICTQSFCQIYKNLTYVCSHVSVLTHPTHHHFTLPHPGILCAWSSPQFPENGVTHTPNDLVCMKMDRIWFSFEEKCQKQRSSWRIESVILRTMKLK